MGKATGFMEYKRETISDIAPLERIKNWDEFKGNYPVERRREQACRCMDCGIPFCHSAVEINGMTSGCPLSNLIPEWNDLIYRGLWQDAVERLYRTNNFPEFTGRVCPAPCEGSCTVGINDPQVTIKNNEYAIAERAYSFGLVRPIIPDNRTGKRVAIVGSGPSGLACAEQLNRAGHCVTVFERDDRLGGLLTYGIPNMKLNKSIIRKRIGIMKASGIEFKTGVEVGVNFDAMELYNSFDAVVLCIGSTTPRDLEVEERDLQGIHFAMDFLKASTKCLLDKKYCEESQISAKDKNVVIIGGGDTGTDCVATSIRQGCKSVIQLEILPKPPSTRLHDNPWPEWPKVLKVDYGQEECIELFGEDPRRYCTMTKRFFRDNDGNVKSVEVVNVEWVKDNNGKFYTKEIEGSVKVLDTDLVLIAMGFKGPENKLLDSLQINRDSKTNIVAKYGKFETNVKGIFAAGDARRGQSLVVWAIHEGRSVACEVDRFLMSGK